MTCFVYWSTDTEQWEVSREEEKFFFNEKGLYLANSLDDLWNAIEDISLNEWMTLDAIKRVVTDYLKITEQDRFQEFFHKHYRGDLPRIPEFWS